MTEIEKALYDLLGAMGPLDPRMPKRAALLAAITRREAEVRKAARDLLDLYPTKGEAWERWADIGPCPCYDGGEGWECSCDEESRRIALKLSVAALRALIKEQP